MDTPGFDDTTRSEADILCDLAQWLEATYVRGFLLTGIIFVQRIDTPRMSGSMVRHLKMFRRLCGRSALCNVVLVTTCWDRIEPKMGVNKEQELIEEPHFWGAMVERGSRALRHSGDSESALRIIESLLHRDEVTLQLQRELVDERMVLAETAAGAVLYEEINANKARYAEQLRELESGMFCAVAENDEELAKQLAYQQKCLEQQIQQSKAMQESLNTERHHAVELSEETLKSIATDNN